MKKLFITFSILICSIIHIMGQDNHRDNQDNQRGKSIYFELLGPSNMVGVSYDARFKGNDHFGYRVGLGYNYGIAEMSSLFNSKSHAFTILMDINYLVGRGSSRLELGLGVSLGYYYSHWHILGEEDSASAFGYFCYGNVGYRLTTKRGFQFRIGVTPTFNLGGDHAVKHDAKIYPYLSFGYAF